MSEITAQDPSKSLFKRIVVNAVIIILSVLFCLLLLELVLRTGIFDKEDSPSPVWIPHKFIKVHDEINQKNWQFAKQNPYRFTDKPRELEKRTGLTRLAILGDSFVWGYAIPFKQTWNHKLEKMIINKYEGFEVLHWGQGAWSTIDELSFLEKDGVQYDIDMLIVGWVDNDPDMRDFGNKHYTWQKHFLVKVLRFFFPNSMSFIISHVNKFLTTHFYTDHQYHNWVKRLYSDENLKKYSHLLRDLSSFCNSKNIKLLFVLTPQRYDDQIREEFDKIIPLIEEANIEYLNLFPAVKKELGHINPRKLWANPADGHPGTLLTDLYAKHVFNYLENQGTFLKDRVSRADLLLKQYRENKNDFSAIKDLMNMALTEGNWNIRKEAAVALGKTDDPRAVDHLIAVLKENSPDIREAAVDALGELHDPRTVKPLITSLGDKDTHVRKRAVMSLGRKNDPAIIGPLITTALNDSDHFVRRRALLTLTKIHDPRIVECLIKSLKDKFYFNRKTAIVALGKKKDKRAVEPLVDLLSDENRDIRAETVDALGNIHDPRTVQVLKETSLNDKDPYVRDLAADAIKKITGKEFGKYRRKLLRMWQMF